MRHFLRPDFADRIAMLGLRLAAAANLLFLLAFLLTAAFAVGRARAEDVACTGKDLLAALRKERPDEARAVEAEAAKTPNGRGLLWRIDKPGVAPSYLFGTMHLTDPRVTTLPAAAQRAFDGAGTLVIETTEVLDETKLAAAMFAQPELTMFTDQTTLTSLLSPEDARLVDTALEKRGIPPASVAKMKPWIVSALLSLPACEVARKSGGAAVLDVKLARDAQAAGKSVQGLETVADQLRAMASLPISFHLKGLVETLRLGDSMNDVSETMISLYREGETGMFWPLFKVVLPPGADDEAGYAAFDETMITGRNTGMVDGSRAMIDKGGAFIAIGAMHLPGADGLVERLRRAGYTVSRVPDA